MSDFPAIMNCTFEVERTSVQTDVKKYILVLLFNIIPLNKRNSTRSNTYTVDLKTDAAKPTSKIIDKNIFPCNWH